MTKPSHGTVTHMLEASEGTPEALANVLPLVYGELRRLASHLLRGERPDHTLLTTELVHEAYLRLFGLEKIVFTDQRHFFRIAATTMRRLLVEHERKRRANKRIPPGAKIPLDLANEPAQLPKVDLLLLDDVLNRLADLDARQARILELRYFAGLTEAQVAEVLDVSRATVTREMRAAKLWLRDRMQS